MVRDMLSALGFKRKTSFITSINICQLIKRNIELPDEKYWEGTPTTGCEQKSKLCLTCPPPHSYCQACNDLYLFVYAHSFLKLLLVDILTTWPYNGQKDVMKELQ